MIRKGGIFGLGEADTFGFGAVDAAALDFSKAVGKTNNPLALGVQKALHTQGYTSLPVDGDWADCSQAALIDHVKTSGVVTRVPSPASDPAGALSALTKAVQGAFNWQAAGVDPKQVKPWIKDGSACASWAKDKNGKPYDPNTAKRLSGASPYSGCLPAVVIACELGQTYAADDYCKSLDPNSVADCCGCVKKGVPDVPAAAPPAAGVTVKSVFDFIKSGGDRSKLGGMLPADMPPPPPAAPAKPLVTVRATDSSKKTTQNAPSLPPAVGTSKWLYLILLLLVAGGGYAGYRYYTSGDSPASDLGDDSDFAMANRRRRHRRGKARRRR